MMENIAVARIYNEVTGANITHRDVQQWGFMESEIVMIAIDLLGIK